MITSSQSPGLDPPEITSHVTTSECQAALSTFIMYFSSGHGGIQVIALRIEVLEDDIVSTIIQSSKMIGS